MLPAQYQYYNGKRKWPTIGLSQHGAPPNDGVVTIHAILTLLDDFTTTFVTFSTPKMTDSVLYMHFWLGPIRKPFRRPLLALRNY